jgi:hypothetical protein
MPHFFLLAQTTPDVFPTLGTTHRRQPSAAAGTSGISQHAMSSLPGILKCFLFLTAFFLFWPFVSAVEVVLPQELPAHPRLYFTKQREAELKKLRETDPFLDKVVKEIIKKADRLLPDKPTHYVLPDGQRLLSQSKRCGERTTALAFAYRMTGDKKYADAAIAEMLSVCRFKDWHPSHFLDTTEMTFAVACGYDWLYDVIPDKQRTEIKNALLNLGLRVGLSHYQKKAWWTKAHNNWNEICNSGLTVGALAVAEEDRNLSGKIVNAAVQSLPNGLSIYKPDGAYPEGPGYWHGGQTYSELMIFALKDVLGSDFNFSKTEGLSVTGDFLIGMFGPTNQTFNYADGTLVTASPPAIFALARLFNRPDYAYWLKKNVESSKNAWTHGVYTVFYALWYVPADVRAFSGKPLASVWHGVQDVASMRTSWTDPNAAFVGLKGGNNRAGHGHLDIGSFVYEVDSIRWAVELGADDYNIPGYWDGNKRRWDIFRLNNRSHNTLVIGGKLQNFAAISKIVSFEKNPDEKIIARAVIDMTEAYKDQAKSAKRTTILRKDGTLLIEDILEGVAETVRWGMATRAAISIDGKVAVLTEQGKKLRIEIVANGETAFKEISATPPTERENQNAGYKMLVAFVKPVNGNVKITVQMNRKP